MQLPTNVGNSFFPAMHYAWSGLNLPGMMACPFALLGKRYVAGPDNQNVLPRRGKDVCDCPAFEIHSFKPSIHRVILIKVLGKRKAILKCRRL